MDARPEGILIVATSAGPGQVREQKVRFSDLQGLLDACVSQADGAAFVRVQVRGSSGGERRRLVLDFGLFGRDEG